jgi:hypothetical protein
MMMLSSNEVKVKFCEVPAQQRANVQECEGDTAPGHWGVIFRCNWPQAQCRCIYIRHIQHEDILERPMGVNVDLLSKRYCLKAGDHGQLLALPGTHHADQS